MDDINKTKLTPSEVMKQWKLGRTKLYDLMSEGKLSYEKTENGKRRIDLSEAVRVFGEPASDKTVNIPAQNILLVQALQNQLAMQEKNHEQHTKALQDRIEAQQNQIDTMVDVVRLLKHEQKPSTTVREEVKIPNLTPMQKQAAPQPAKRRRSLFGRLLAAAVEN